MYKEYTHMIYSLLYKEYTHMTYSLPIFDNPHIILHISDGYQRNW